MNTAEALETLLAQLRAALKDAQQEGADAMRRSDFARARKAAERCEAIQKHVDHLEALRRDLPRLTGERPSEPATPARPAKGTRTPGSAYRIPILQVLTEMGGKGRMADVLDRVYRIMEHRLTEVDLQPLPSGHVVRWRNAAQWERLYMCHDGLLASDSPQGIWEITDQGRQYLREYGG